MPEKKSFWQNFSQTAVSRNPVLIQMLAICTIMAAGTLKLAVLFSVSFCIMFFVTQSLANLFMGKWHRYFRVAAYAAIGAFCAFGLLFLLENLDDSDFTIDAGIYLPMLAVSGITVLHCEKVSVNSDFMTSLKEALARSIGYCAILLFTGALREFLGRGELWGYTIIPDFGIALISHPMGALFILGFLAALLREAVHRFFHPYVEEVALKVSETPITVAELPMEPEPEIPEYVPLSGELPELENEVNPIIYDEPITEDVIVTDLMAPQPEPEPTAPPPQLEDTQQKFDEMLAELKRRYLDNE